MKRTARGLRPKRKVIASHGPVALRGAATAAEVLEGTAAPVARVARQRGGGAWLTPVEAVDPKIESKPELTEAEK